MKNHKSKRSGGANASLAQRMAEKINTIDQASKDLPSVIIIHNLKTRSVEYMSERGLRILKKTLPELKNLGPDYFEKFFNPEDAQNYIPRFLALLDKNDLEETFCYFQQVRGSEDEEWRWYLSSVKVLMNDDDGKPCLSITSAHPVDELKSITYKIERLLEEKEYMRNEFSKYALLTKREKEIIKLVVSGDSSVKIAEKLNISFATAEQHRKNIKNKLEIKNLPDIVRFAQAFDLV